MARPPDKHDNQNDAPEDENVLEFTPEDDASIEDIANMVVDMMEDYGMDCDVHFPDFTMEVERGASPADIVNGYGEILKQLAAQMPEQPE